MIQKDIQSKDGVKIHYEVFEGNKPTRTFVFVHGFGGCLRAFDPLVAHFQKKNFKTINIDLRAHGKSTRPKKAFQHDLNVFIEDIVAIIEKEKAKNVTLLGHCFGGIISLKLVAEHQKLIKSLVLMSVSYKAPNLSRIFYKYFPFKALIFKIVDFLPHFYLKKYPSYAKYKKSGDFNPIRICSDIFHTSPKSYLYISREVVNINFSKQIPAIKQPVLLIHGEKDRVFPIKIAKELQKNLKNSKLETIKQANHLLVLNSNPELIKLIEENLSQNFI